jgi:hypothetical protein
LSRSSSAAAEGDAQEDDKGQHHHHQDDEKHDEKVAIRVGALEDLHRVRVVLVGEQQHAAVVVELEIGELEDAEALTVVRGGVEAGEGAVVEIGAVELGPVALERRRSRLVDVLPDRVVRLQVQVVHPVDGGFGRGGQDDHSGHGLQQAQHFHVDAAGIGNSRWCVFVFVAFPRPNKWTLCCVRVLTGCAVVHTEGIPPPVVAR